jgi:hypothetical protein
MDGWMGSSLRYRQTVAASSTSLAEYLPFFLSHQGSISFTKQKPHIKHNSHKHGSNDPRKKQLKREGGEENEMEGHVGQFFESVSSIFRGSDTLPVCDRDIIAVSTLPIHTPAPSSSSPMDFLFRSAAGAPNFRWDVRGFTN